jgi:SAM-dependent methyltransferase
MVERRITRHLDLGCGDRPRNPYRCDEVHGVDIRAERALDGSEIRKANLAVEAIPYPDNYFDSVSAYDFLEHVPRILPCSGGTRFPFIELMNEIWRVLVNSGRLYASTPAYPHPAAFQDPTHVNILTRGSHTYFTRPDLAGRMYGFVGDFAVIRVVRAVGGEFEYEPEKARNFVRRYQQRRRERCGHTSHLIWEFRAHKASQTDA